MVSENDPGGSSTVRLHPEKWWPAVIALALCLAPFWARRTAVWSAAAEGDKKVEGDKKSGASDADDEWPGLNAGTNQDQAGPGGTGRDPVQSGPEKPQILIVSLAPCLTGLARSEEVRRWLRAAEDLIALVLVKQLAWLRSALVSIVSFLVAGPLAMTLVLTSYPFQPQGRLLTILGVLTAVTVSVVAVIAVETSRDEAFSRVRKTPPNRLTFDRQFLTTLVTCIVPLLGLLGALSFGMSDLVRSWLEPLFR